MNENARHWTYLLPTLNSMAIVLLYDYDRER